MRRYIRESEAPLSKVVVKLFQVLNEEKKKHKTKAELLNAIKNLMPYFGIPKNSELYLLELYTLNYRKDGDYGNLTKDNFVDPRDLSGKKTSNKMSNLYTIAMMPFRGSNLRGFWSKDVNGVPQYIVESYDWYPIYIYKQGRWYEVQDRYSSSTSKHISYSNPVQYNESLDENVFVLTRDEMKKLQLGATHADIIKHKLEKLKEFEPSLTKRKMSVAGDHTTYDEELNDYIPGYYVKYKVNSIDFDDDSATINIDIHDVLKRVNNTRIPTPENYFKGEIAGITPERVEKTITRHLRRDISKFVGPRFFGREIPKTSKVKLKFNHLRGNE